MSGSALNYEPISLSAHRPVLGVILGASFFAGHVLVELLTCVILFYIFGLLKTTTNSLWDLEEFQIFFAIESFVAVLGGLYVGLVITAVPLRGGFLPVPLCALSFGLGGFGIGFQWIVCAIAPSKLNLAILFTIISATTACSAFILLAAVRFQTRAARQQL